MENWQPCWTEYKGRALLLPRWGTRRTERPSLGPAVAEVANSLGTPFMPWQQYVADVALELNPTTRRPVYREVWITVPRQSGKTTLVLALAVHRAIGFGRAQRIVYAAQTRNDARKKWEDDHRPVLEASPLGALMRTRLTTGGEAFIWKNGSMHGITSNTEKAGHGPTLDLGFIDEAFAQEDNRLEQAFRPSMVTRKDAQMWGLSTAGWKDGSPYLWSKVQMGRHLAERGEDYGVAYFEWSAPDGWDLEDPETWRAVMPALGHTIDEDIIRADLVSMKESEEGVAGFARAYLNRWVAKRVRIPPISTYSWSACADLTSVLGEDFALGVDMDPERTKVAVAAYGANTGGTDHGEVLEHRSGTAWAEDRVVELVRKWTPSAVVIDPSSPAGSLIAGLEDRGLSVTQPSVRMVAQATGALYDRIAAGTFRHRNQADLNAAVGAAVKRFTADAFVWDRRHSADDVTPLTALTLAEHGHAASHGETRYDPLQSVL